MAAACPQLWPRSLTSLKWFPGLGLVVDWRIARAKCAGLNSSRSCTARGQDPPPKGSPPCSPPFSRGSDLSGICPSCTLALQPGPWLLL